MKIVSKKQFRFTITIFCLIVFNLFVTIGCTKPPEKQHKVCNVDNPLTDLSWLKEKIDELHLLFQENPNLSIAIYQCKFGGEKTGFLEDRGNVGFFYTCEGETLCIMGGNAGETCSELNIVSKELIWKINN